jgi:hypothetical protein
VPYPVKDPEVLEIYAGNTVELARIIFDEDLTEWTGWEASWRPAKTSPQTVPLVVDTSELADRTVVVTASAEATERMWELRLGKTDTGVWDVKATRAGEPRTWFWGETKHEGNVTR